MASKAAIFSNFSGGLATDVKFGVKGAAAGLQAFDIRSSPSQMSSLPATVREDAGVLKDLLLNEVMVSNGTIYAVGDQGYVYRRSTGGTWSTIGRLSSGSAGIDYRLDADVVYFTSQKTVSAVTTVVNGTPLLVPDLYAGSYSSYDNSSTAGFNVSAYQLTGTSTTTLGTAIIENSANLRYFQTDIEPVSKIGVFVIAKGTGDWTLTLHDGDNNSLASATVTNANLNNGVFNDFSFTSAPNGQVRLYPAPNARTYHIHVTSTVADGTISSNSKNSMSTCDLRVMADRLAWTHNGWHPMTRFLQYEIIGNGNYISAWEPISSPPTNDEWVRAKLTVPMEYECCGLAATNEFLVAAFEKTSTSTTIGPQEGLIIFWDGTADTYNYFVPIPEGSPYGLHTYANVVYYIAGGSLWAMTSPTTQPVHIRTLPGTSTEFSGTNSPIKVYPAAMSTRREIQVFGFPGTTTNTSINFGVYGWGSVDKNYPTVLTYNYVMSTGSKNYSASNNLSIGMVKSFGDLLHISWRDDLNGKYGVDKVDNSSPPAPTSVWQSIAVDNGYPGKRKTAKYCEVYYKLPAGATIQLAYQFDRSGTWVTDSNSYSTTSLWQGRAGYARFGMTADSSGNNAGTFYEVQMQITITCPSTAATPPKVYMAAIVYDDRREDQI